jgi:hypothetical protein
MSNPWPPGSSSEQTSCHDLPTLTRVSSIATTKSESSSLGARQMVISDSRLLLAEEEGSVLVDNRVPAQGNLECPFNLLFCFKTFSNMEDWVGHSLTHFSNVGPPDYNHCCFCDRGSAPPQRLPAGLDEWSTSLVITDSVLVWLMLDQTLSSIRTCGTIG